MDRPKRIKVSKDITVSGHLIPSGIYKTTDYREEANLVVNGTVHTENKITILIPNTHHTIAINAWTIPYKAFGVDDVEIEETFNLFDDSI